MLTSDYTSNRNDEQLVFRIIFLPVVASPTGKFRSYIVIKNRNALDRITRRNDAMLNHHPSTSVLHVNHRVRHWIENSAQQ